MFNGAFLLGLIILAACVWWACRTAPLEPGEYSRLDRLDGLGTEEFIAHTITGQGGSPELVDYTIRHHGGTA